MRREDRRFIEPIYRPPLEANSLLIQATQSCNWNKCNFCYRDKNYPFQAATPEEIEIQLRKLAPLYPPDTAVFLVGSNTFALPFRKLEIYLQIINEFIPDHGRISMFSRIDAIASKSDEELRKLRELGLTQLYVGTENGNDAALALMSKGHTAAEAVIQLKRLEAAGIAYVAFYILGMGGKGTGQQTALDTAVFFNQLHPRLIGATGMTVTEGTGAWELRKNGQFKDASEREKIMEIRTFLQNLKTETTFNTMHYLNPVHFNLRNADKAKKKQILAEIDRILATYSEEELEKAIDRPRLEESCKPESPGGAA